jgi:hypothetical protein
MLPSTPRTRFNFSPCSTARHLPRRRLIVIQPVTRSYLYVSFGATGHVSGLRGGSTVLDPRPVHRPLNLSIYSLIRKALDAGSPSCCKIVFSLGDFSRSCGRNHDWRMLISAVWLTRLICIRIVRHAAWQLTWTQGWELGSRKKAHILRACIVQAFPSGLPRFRATKYCPRQITWSLTARGWRGKLVTSGSTAHVAPTVSCPFQKHYRKIPRTLQFLLRNRTEWSVNSF